MRHLLTIRHTEAGPGDEPHAGPRPASSVDFARGRDADRPSAHRGTYLIDVANTDEALSWAARHPGARAGTVEVRPVWAWAGMG